MTRLALIFFGVLAGLVATAQERMTDIRDNSTYETAQVSSKVWMKSNLKYNLNNRYFLYLSEGEVYYHADELEDVCPEGWRVPTLEEWQDVADLNELKLKAAGVLDQGRFADFGRSYVYWTSSQDAKGVPVLVSLDTLGSPLVVRPATSNTHASCRCVKE
ncbi:FISUMP domain-containing protein [Marinoscillum furvescens]|uniref:Uncharacterized protein (TIGR02145 family) n=1 Tax=Marinoscillum furvescens DSM 4134 TaxID=1122208 RepID=A0A3D9KVL4_MARFU|nr:FISUMP domain-containing protein [Marinoscillum furvescens]RED91583.1 uncharacterized protein (TIGR02145 family) [Marinoscillum furvescens DSM 4134]